MAGVHIEGMGQDENLNGEQNPAGLDPPNGDGNSFHGRSSPLHVHHEYNYRNELNAEWSVAALGNPPFWSAEGEDDHA